MMFIWLILIVVLGYMFLDKQNLFKKNSFEDILNERLAKGEISIEDYKKLTDAKK